MNNLILITGIISLLITVILLGYIIRYKTTWFKNNKKKIISVFIISGVLLGGGLLLPSDIVGGYTSESVWYSSGSLNSYYRINTSILFNNITIGEPDDFVVFNTTVFKVTSASRVNISIMKINRSITGAGDGDELIDMYANGTGSVNFTIGGFTIAQQYYVKKDTVLVNTTTANASGYISFNNSAWSSHRFIIYMGAGGGPTIYNRTIRTNGIDYFTWLGANTTASVVEDNITGFDEAAEYLAVFNNTGVWVKYYGDGTGTDWSIKTFDVVKSYMTDAVGNITFNMNSNTGINYSAHRTVTLKKIGNGYNYTGYTNTSTGTLSSLNTTLTLPAGYYIAMWNRSTFSWNYWISGFGITDKTVSRWNVLTTKINANKTWVI